MPRLTGMFTSMDFQRLRSNITSISQFEQDLNPALID
jgi:hypothetical protein